jgi:hypothetical protein
MAETSYAIRRANPRFPFSAEAEITLRDGTSVSAQLSEISSRGCYIDALQPVPVGSELHLSIFGGATSCELDGKVIYGHSGGGMGVAGMGVLFGKIGAMQHLTLQTWLNNLATNRSQPAATSSTSDQQRQF